MKPTPEGATLIQRYYKIAPQIFSKIESQSDRSERLEFIYQELILKSIDLIKRGEKELALEYYAVFTLTLEKKFLN